MLKHLKPLAYLLFISAAMVSMNSCKSQKSAKVTKDSGTQESLIESFTSNIDYLAANSFYEKAENDIEAPKKVTIEYLKKLTETNEFTGYRFAEGPDYREENTLIITNSQDTVARIIPVWGNAFMFEFAVSSEVSDEISTMISDNDFLNQNRLVSMNIHKAQEDESKPYTYLMIQIRQLESEPERIYESIPFFRIALEHPADLEYQFE